MSVFPYAMQSNVLEFLLYLIFGISFVFDIWYFLLYLMYGISTVVFCSGANPGAWRNCHVGLLRYHAPVLICQNYRKIFNEAQIGQGIHCGTNTIFHHILYMDVWLQILSP